MGTEFIPGMDSSSGASEHETRLVIQDNIKEVRVKLIAALEKMEYNVVEEQPLIARRAARNGGVSLTSADVLDYPTNLHVGLKSSGENATIATFCYRVTHPMLGKGDKQTLNREAEAICALTRQVHSITNCLKCQAELTEDSRFCRRCGTACEPPEPAELEVLRIAAKSMVSYEFVRLSAIFLTCALAFLLLANIPAMPIKLIKVFNILGLLFSPSIIMLYNGMRHLRQAINRENRQALPTSAKTGALSTRSVLTSQSQSTAEAAPRPLFSSPYKTGEMALPAAPPSITEHTTALLDKEPQPVPVRREREKY